MSVELEPGELGFRRPFTHEVTQVLKLRNPSHEPVAFKVKTTAPKQYCVRPNSGRIEPGDHVEVQVLLQSMKEDPPLDARCRDKFLVQSVAIGASQDSSNITAVWSGIEKTAKESIKERKIRVTFLPAHDPNEGTPGSHHAIVNGDHPEEAPPAYRSPSPSLGSPTSHQNTPYRETSETSKELPSEQKPSTMEAASASVSAAASSAGQTIQQQLDAAKDTIAGLRGQLDEQGLRQRKTDASAQDSKDRATAGGTSMSMQTPATEGVPVQIVAALCLLSFLLAYFFF